MKQILIVEDDTLIAQNIAEILEYEGYSTVISESETEAVDLIVINEYALVLCDVMLKEGNGMHVLQRVTDLLAGMVPPFIFITGKTDRQSQRHAMELGADDYLTKPFTGDELVNTVRTNLLKREMIIKSSLSNKIEEQGQETSTPANLKRFKLEDKIFVSTKAGGEFIFIRDIMYIESSREYTKIVSSSQRKFIVKKSMQQWEDELPTDVFVRIHRKHIVNITFITNIVSLPNRLFRVHLIGATTTLTISQRMGKALKESFSVFVNSKK